MERLFVTLGHNQTNKLIRIAPCLSIDFSDGAGIIWMTPGLNPRKRRYCGGGAVELFDAVDGFDWVGFYQVVAPGVLKLRPYQGGHG